MLKDRQTFGKLFLKSCEQRKLVWHVNLQHILFMAILCFLLYPEIVVCLNAIICDVVVYMLCLVSTYIIRFDERVHAVHRPNSPRVPRKQEAIYQNNTGRNSFLQMRFVVCDLWC